MSSFARPSPQHLEALAHFGSTPTGQKVLEFLKEERLACADRLADTPQNSDLLGPLQGRVRFLKEFEKLVGDAISAVRKP